MIPAILKQRGQTVEAHMTGTPSSTLLTDTMTISMQVARELRQRILNGIYVEGEKLQQAKLAAELGVSRSPIREAMGQLVAEGLVVFTPQKGAQVAGIHLAEISELFEIRAMVEPHLLSLAIPNMKTSDLARANDVATEMEQISLDDWSDANWRFHEVLYRPAQRPTTLAMVGKMHGTIRRYLRMQLSATDGRIAAGREHRKLLNACEQGDVSNSVLLLRSHIEAAGQFSKRVKISDI